MPWWLDTRAFVALLAIRLFAASTAPIMDCDETFNYWDPLHYVLHGTGMQTWEYSPQYALRSWVYVELHALVLRVLPASLAAGPSGFYALRQCLALLCASCEMSFVRAIASRFGTRPAALVLVFMGAGSGMFHAGVTLLPSTTCAYCVMLGYAAWFTGRPRLGLLCGCFAVVLVWPFVAPMFVPMGLHALTTLGVRPVLGCAVGGLAAFGVLPAVVDGYAYYSAGKPVSAIGNLVLYNVLGSGGGGEGANLYGVEPWSFYPRNLVLNWGVVAPLGVCSAAILVALPRSTGGGKGGKAWGLLALAGMYATLAVLQPMAHKEERFLTMIYPTLCLGAALALDAALALLVDGVSAERNGVPRRMIATAARAATGVAVGSFVALSVARSAALVHNYAAPLAVYAALPPGAQRVCVGKEWYRFPSSFFLPPGAPPLLWVRGGFRGQLPQPFGPWPGGMSATPAHMNDRNLDEPSRYASERSCEYIVDLDLADQAEPSVVRDGAHWERVHCAPFLDAGRSTSTLARAFYIPGFSARRNVYAEYCLMKRRR